MALSPSAVPALLTVEKREQVFERVWQLVDEQYLHSDFRGMDWNAIRDEFAPLVRSADSDVAFYDLMTEMVTLLDDQHSRFVTPQSDAGFTVGSLSQPGISGIGVMVRPESAYGFIQTVFPDSPAARAGLRPRDRIISVDNRPYLASDADLSGPPDTQVRLSIVRPGDRPHDVILERQLVQPRISPYARRFPGEIGYIVVPTLWVNDMDDQVSGTLTELHAAGALNGLILDLRGNGGGWEHVMSGVLSHFVRGQVGTFYSRTSQRPLVISEPVGPDLRGQPLIVLIDKNTSSYAEVIAAILQRDAAATVVGSVSAGNTETIYAHPLPDGSQLWLAQEGFRLPDGLVLEGRGVQPDVLVESNWQKFSEDDDPYLLEALRLIGAGPK
jgi:C-terminal peptidase prc